MHSCNLQKYFVYNIACCISIHQIYRDVCPLCGSMHYIYTIGCIYIWSAITVGPHYLCVMLCNAVTSITAMCVCLSLPCCHLFIPIESSIELYTHNTPVCLSCIHMTHLYFLVKALVVDFFGFG